MPFKSEKQRRYLYANEPKLAKKWSNMYGKKIIGLGNISAEDILDRAFSQVYKQGYKDREDESLGMRKGAEKGKKQSYKDRRNESYGKFGKRDKEKKGKNEINIIKEDNSKSNLRKLWRANKITADEYFFRTSARKAKIPTYKGFDKITGLGGIKPTISKIKSRTLKKAPYFFSKNTMNFFGQRMSDYKVKRSPKGKIFIYAPTYDAMGTKMPYTFMEFKNDDLIAQKGIYESESEILKYISKR